jgi:prepilin-type N-terminal cleavage/methylation domain-containing protein
MKGFTLVEIIIVVIIITILALIAIPNMLRANVTSNEANAIANLRSIYTALQIYYTSNNKTYPEELADLEDYVGSKLANGEKSGYLYEYTYEDEDTFYINAAPKRPNRTGVRYFYMDETGVIRYNAGGIAGENDTIAE